MVSQYRHQLLLLAGDVPIILAATVLAHLIRFGVPVMPSEVPTSGWVISLALFLGSMYVFNLYDLGLLRTRQVVLSRTIAAFILATVVVVSIFYALPGHKYGRGVLALQVILATAGTLSWRYIFFQLLPVALRSRRLLIIGGGPAAQKIIDVLREETLPFKIVGLLSEGPNATGVPVLGRPQEVARLAREHQAEMVVLASKDHLSPGLTADLLDLKLKGVECLEMPLLYERLTRRIPAEHIHDEWLLAAGGFHLLSSQMTKRVKRLIDIIVGGFLLAVLSPLSLLIAVAIKLDSPGPVFYVQTRTGLGNSSFKLIKFRSMTVRAEPEGPQWATKNDERVTRLGRRLRAYRLDEIPQLINVLAGQMSLVGPRPERPEFVEQLEDLIPYYRLRHLVRPGLTGWAQINFGYASSPGEALPKLEYELYYVKNMSLFFDVKIILKTIGVVFLPPAAPRT